MSQATQARADTSAVQAQVRDRRRQLGLHAFTVAQLAGIHPVEYSRIERGAQRATPERLRIIDNILLQYERAQAAILRASGARLLSSAQK